MLALSVACTAAAVVWAYLVLGHGQYWLTGQRLPPVTGQRLPPVTGQRLPPAAASSEPDRWPRVVAVIPARNEAAMLPLVLPALLGQDYPGALTVILVDDCSTDGTAEVAAALAAKQAAEIGDAAEAGERRALRVLPGAPLPPGWAGKVWAMSQGLAHGLAVAGDAQYVLFTDADIAWEGRALRDLVRAAEAGDRDLVSQMALLRTATAWERVIVPAFVYFFAQLYPFARVNSARSRTAAAAGGCMLVRRAALERSGGLDPIRGARIDDVALGRVIKGQRGRCWLGLSTAVVSVRPYPRLADLWQMVSRSAYIQLRYSPWLLAGTVAGLAFVYLLPPAGAIIGLTALATGAATTGAATAGAAAGAATAGAGSGTAAAITAATGLAGWALMSLTFLPMLRLYRLSPLRAPGLPLIALLYTAMTADSARRHYAGRGAEWKGRTDRARLGFPPWLTSRQTSRQTSTCGRTIRDPAGAGTSSPTSSPAPRSKAIRSRCSRTAAAWART